MNISINININRKGLFCLFFMLILTLVKEAIAFENFEGVAFIREIKYGLSSPVDVVVNGGGDIYVLDQETSQVSVYSKDGDFKFSFGSIGEEKGEFKLPQSLSTSPNGNIIVADTGNDRIQIFNKLGRFISQFGTSGSKPGQFRSPIAVDVDHFGFIFVLEKDNRRIQIFSPMGVYLKTIGLSNRGVDFSIDFERNIFLLAPDINKIVKLSSQGQHLGDFECNMGGKNYVDDAQGVVVNFQGDIIITENSEHSIKKFSEDGKILASFGSEGDGRGRFNNVRGLDTDAQNFIYVADTKNNRVQILELFGNDKVALDKSLISPPIVEFYSNIKLTDANVDVDTVTGLGVYVLNQLNGEIMFKREGAGDVLISKLGENVGELMNPKALNVTLNGEIYVADSGNNRIQIFNSEGVYEYHFGNRGNKSGQFQKPEGIVVNSKGTIYISDTQNNRIQVFTNDGIYLKSFGQRANGKRGDYGHLAQPKSLATDSRDNIYVLDYGNDRVQVFDEYGGFVRAIGEQGNNLGQFEDITDIFIDENNLLYVADNGNHRIQMFNRKGKFLLSFGALGEEKGYFKDITGVAVAQNKIFVTDYEKNYVQIFRYFPDGLRKEQRAYVTQTATPPQDYKGNDVLKYSIARREAVNRAAYELIQGAPYSFDHLKNFIQVDSIQVMRNGLIKATVSIPQNIPPEPKRVKRKVEPKRKTTKRKPHPWDW